MKRFLILTVCIFCAVPALAADPPSLCEEGEQVFFTCATEKDKIVSLCGSKDLVRGSGYMQYRLGAAGKTEHEYPAERKTPASENFYMGHFNRVGSDVRRIGFHDGKDIVELFWFDGGAEGVETKISGVAVIHDGKGDAVKEQICREPVTMNLGKLDWNIPCQKGTHDCDLLNVGQ